MSDPFPILMPGDPVSKLTAEGMNRVFDMAREREGSRRLLSQVANLSPPQFASAGWGNAVKIVNDTEEDLPIGGIVSIGGICQNLDYARNDFLRYPVFKGGVPLNANVCGVCRDPIPVASAGIAYLAGLAICKIDMISNQHRFAAPIDYEPGKLTSVPLSSNRILATENNFAEGEQLAAVILAAPYVGVRPFTATGPMGEGDLDSDEINVDWEDNLGGSGVAWDRWGEYSELDSGMHGHAQLIDGKMEIIGINDCDGYTV